MKSKFIAVFTFIAITIGLSSCFFGPPKHKFTNDEIEVVVQEFTVLRINQFLRPSETLMDNRTIFLRLIQQHGYNPHEFWMQFKERKPKLYNKLFKESDGK